MWNQKSSFYGELYNFLKRENRTLALQRRENFIYVKGVNEFEYNALMEMYAQRVKNIQEFLYKKLLKKYIETPRTYTEVIDGQKRKFTIAVQGEMVYRIYENSSMYRNEGIYRMQPLKEFLQEMICKHDLPSMWKGLING